MECIHCQQEIETSEHYDARGIYITRCCDDCWEKIRRKYRRDVLEDPHYVADEPIEPEDDYSEPLYW